MAAGTSTNRHRTRHTPPGSYRLIGGAWRRQRVAVPGGAEVRPTPDRVRETVFNWLAPLIEGARCLDLFAGSGALGFEALSRGAAEAVFVDRDAHVVRHLRNQLERFRCERGTTRCQDALQYLAGPVSRYDVVFLDPPYRQGLLEPTVSRLVERGWVGPGSVVYLEHEAACAVPVLPSGWTLARSAAAGQVRYHLARFEPHTAGQT